MSESPGTRLSQRSTAPPDPRTGATGRLPLLAGGAALVVALVGWLLLLPPVSLLRGGDDWRDAGGDLVRRRDNPPAAPAGFVIVSPYYEIRAREEQGAGPAAVTVPLGDGKGGRGLALFSHQDGQWRRLAAAEILPDGRSARAQVDQLPENMIVMRRASGGFQVQGIVPDGAALHPEANALTIISATGYLPLADGTLTGELTTRPADDSVVQAPVVRAEGGAEAEAVNSLLASEAARGVHVEALAALVRSNRLDGIDLEYSAINPQLGPGFTALVTALAAELHRTGQTVTVALPLPRRDGSNWNTLGYDWKELGRVADYVRILPERDQSLYRRTVRDALNYITGQVEAKKVVLTLNPLATERSTDGTIRELTALEALSLASQINVRDRDRLAAGVDVQVSAEHLNREGAPPGLLWDATAAAVSFAHQTGGMLRTVWIENAFSASFKLELVQLWGLGGVAVADASDSQGGANLWPAIAHYLGEGAPQLVQPNSNLLKPEWLVDGKREAVARGAFTWKAPEPGDHKIEMIVGDGAMRVLNSTTVTVRPASAVPLPPGRTPTAPPAGR